VPDGTGPEGRGTWGRICQTNPILGKAQWDEATGAGDAGQSCKTNPIRPGQPGRGAGGRRTPPGHDGAKQSQFAQEQREGQVLGGKGVMVNRAFDRLRQNKANPAWGGQSCETNPIPGDAGRAGVLVRTNPIPATMPIGRSAFPGGQMRKTNPIWPTLGGAGSPTGERCDIASMPRFGKRTQFPADGPERPLSRPGASRGGLARPIAPNEPNYRQSQVGWGPCTNKPNSCQEAGRSAFPGRANAPNEPNLHCGLRIVQNEPNSRSRRVGRVRIADNAYFAHCYGSHQENRREIQRQYFRLLLTGRRDDDILID
jgi:hypothetical protein